MIYNAILLSFVTILLPFMQQLQGPHPTAVGEGADTVAGGVSTCAGTVR